MDEDIFHLFYDCTVVRDFWNRLTNKFIEKGVACRSFFLPKEVILLGVAPNFKTSKILDMVLVMAKMYIYRQKVNKKGLSLNTFLKEIKERCLMEKYSSILDDSYDKYASKWAPFLPILEG